MHSCKCDRGSRSKSGTESVLSQDIKLFLQLLLLAPSFDYCWKQLIGSTCVVMVGRSIFSVLNIIFPFHPGHLWYVQGRVGIWKFPPWANCYKMKYLRKISTSIHFWDFIPDNRHNYLMFIKISTLSLDHGLQAASAALAYFVDITCKHELILKWWLHLGGQYCNIR